jgi:hypothetical protein
MTDDGFKFSEEGKRTRFAQWEKIGVERIKHDLLNGGYRLVGGPPVEQELAWEWVRMKEAEQREVVTLKPTLWGVGIDLKEMGRRVVRRFKG